MKSIVSQFMLQLSHEEKLELLADLKAAIADECVLSSSRRQNRRYDFDTFSVLRADRLSYF